MKKLTILFVILLTGVTVLTVLYGYRNAGVQYINSEPVPAAPAAENSSTPEPVSAVTEASPDPKLQSPASEGTLPTAPSATPASTPAAADGTRVSPSPATPKPEVTTPAATAPTQGTSAPTSTSSPTPSPSPTATPTPSPSSAQEDKIRVFTLEELAGYNGKNGNPAYVAVDGIVYDVTNSSLWKNGTHQGRFEAGRDLTKEIKTLSPHGTSKLKGLKAVGRLK